MLSEILRTVYLGVSYIVTVAYNVIAGGDLPGPGAIFWMLLVFTLWFGSAFFAATVAEVFGYSIPRHLLGGLALPWIYPARMVKKLPMLHRDVLAAEAEAKEERHVEQIEDSTGHFAEVQAERRAARLARTNALRAAAGLAPKAEEAEPAPEPVPAAEASDGGENGAAEPSIGQQIHDALYEQPIDSDGRRVGPYRLYLKDGGTMEIEYIRSMQSELMVCVMCGNGKTLRVRFENLIGVEQIEAEQK